MSAKKKQLSYSEAMAELEAIVGGIESESIDVDSLADRIKRAQFLIGYLKGRLRSTEDEVKKVLTGLEKGAEGPEEGKEEGTGAPADADDKDELF